MFWAGILSGEASRETREMTPHHIVRSETRVAWKLVRTENETQTLYSAHRLSLGVYNTPATQLKLKFLISSEDFSLNGYACTGAKE